MALLHASYGLTSFQSYAKHNWNTKCLDEEETRTRVIYFLLIFLPYLIWFFDYYQQFSMVLYLSTIKLRRTKIVFILFIKIAPECLKLICIGIFCFLYCSKRDVFSTLSYVYDGVFANIVNYFYSLLSGYRT